MSNLKFKLTNETKLNWLGQTLFRIEATVDIPSRNVKKGDKGGWVESEEVNGNARVSGNAWVSGDAEVYGNARVSGNAWVYGNAEVYGNARVYGDARVYGNAEVYGNARVYGNAEVYGNAWVYGDAWVYGNARVYGNAEVYGNARVSGNAWVSGDAEVSGNARVSGDAWVYGDAKLSLKKAFTKGFFLHSNDSTINSTIIDQSKEDGFDIPDDYKYLLVVGDYEIEDIDPKPTTSEESIEIEGKKYTLSEIKKALGKE